MTDHRLYRGCGSFQLSVRDLRGALRAIGPAVPNMWCSTWGSIVARVIRGEAAYIPSTFYIEFQNVATPETPVSIPTLSEEIGRSYYDGLGSSFVRDYLRVPILTQPGVDVDPAHASTLSADQGNRLLLMARTSASVGANGVAFSNALNSKVCGFAWVATPVPDDPTRDLVFSRAYYEADAQMVAPISGQLSVEYRPTFV